MACLYEFFCFYSFFLLDQKLIYQITNGFFNILIYKDENANILHKSFTHFVHFYSFTK